jgi:hypothetical protein
MPATNKPLILLIKEMAKKQNLSKDQEREWVALCKIAYNQGSDDCHKMLLLKKVF